MSVHLLRQGLRTCRLTTFRFASSRRPLTAQATQTLHDLAPDASTSQLNQDQPPSTEADAFITQSEPAAPQTENTTKKRRRSRKTTQSEPDDTPSRDHLQPTRVDLYLASLAATGVEPQLADIERCRPRRHPPPESAAYAGAYNTLVETLCRSFSKEQLRVFIEKYGLDRSLSKKHRVKVEYAEAIIEAQWKWPSLKAIEKAQRDRTEVVIESFPVTPSQLFLILGQDGVDLLQLTMQYKVHISLSPKPLALRAEGVRAAINGLSKRLSEIKRAVVEETFQLPTSTPVQPELVQRISRLAGAYIENIGSTGLIRLCTKRSKDLDSAKRLATRAITEFHIARNTPLLSYLPMGVPSMSHVPAVLFPHSYSLYPFLSTQNLPWYMNATSVFRLRRVGEWLGSETGESIDKTGGLAGEKGRILTVKHEAVDLKDVLLGPLASQDIQPPESKRTIRASLGHMLFSSPSNDRRSLVPPLSGAYQFAKVLEWIENHQARTTFVSSLPTTLVHTSPSHQQLIHRLIYKALPSGPPDASPAEVNDTSPITHTINLEVVLARPKEPRSDEDAEVEAKSEPLSFTPHCWQAKETDLDLLLPDRPLDVRYTLSDSTDIPETEAPRDLQEYISAMKVFMSSKDKAAKPPHAPLMLYCNRLTYVLHTTANVRRNVEEVKQDGDGEVSDALVQVVSESIMDLESSERTTRCEILCADPSSTAGWHQFLQRCDLLSNDGYRPATISSESVQI